MEPAREDRVAGEAKAGRATPAFRLIDDDGGEAEGFTQLQLPLVWARLAERPPAEARVVAHGRWIAESPGGSAFELDVIVATPEGWAARPESASPCWWPRRLGPLVVAVRVLF